MNISRLNGENDEDQQSNGRNQQDMELHLKIYLPEGELYGHTFPLRCTISDIREVIERDKIAQEGEYVFVIGSDSGTVLS